MHDTITRGDTVFCRLCGKSWDVSEEMPEVCIEAATGTPPRASAQTQPSRPAQEPVAINPRLKAWLVGPDWTGVPPALVYAFDELNAREALSTITGIHPVELTAIPAPKMDEYCKMRVPCPSFNPMDLERASKLHRDDLLANFGATAVANPFKAKAKKHRKS